MENPTVNAACGQIVGRVKEDSLLFAGIPYAQAPVNNLRFKPPQPMAEFVEPFQALKMCLKRT